MEAAGLVQIKKTLLRNPRRLDARAAALRVISERYKCGPALAKQRLDGLRDCHETNELFRSVMPKEYALELKKAGGSRIDVAAKFFSSLGFPIQDEVVGDMIHGDAYYFGIPIVCLAFHACPNCYEFEALALPYQLAFIMSRSTDSEFGTGPDCDQSENTKDDWRHLATKYRLAGRLQPRGAVDLELLVQNFAALKTPLRFIPDVMRAITYSTGSIFMDFDEEDGSPDIEWSARNVEALRKEYQIALDVDRRIKELDKWLEEHPAPRVTDALRIFARTRKQTDERTKRPNQGIALVRVF